VPSAPAADPLPHHAWYDEVVMPALLESARATYGRAIRRALTDAGFDDVPRRGMALVGGIARNGPAAQQDLSRFLSMSKQSASALVDTLVTRGYLEREPDPADRRRVLLTLTERGEQAAAVSAAAVGTVDAAIARRFSAAELATTRRVLGATISLGERARERRRTEPGAASP
jgi:DNA-binding MarR family transcriptional regulator